MRCWVKSRNERNPYPLLPREGVSEETAGDELEEGGDDVKSSWPLCPGQHTCYNGEYRGERDREVEPIPKIRRSWDRSLQLDSVNVESLVIVDQHATVNTFPGLVHTARHTTKACCTRSWWANPQGGQPSKVWPVIGVKS